MTAAVALTFDDLNVAGWCAARPIFDAFSARVTFCVCRLHKATAEEVTGLRALQADGHEIAFHTRTHPNLHRYLKRHGLAHWLAHEIDAGVAEHRQMGFPARSFASPYHASTPETRAETAKRFAVTRADGPRGVTQETCRSRIYSRANPDGTVNCIGFCDFQLAAFPGWQHQMRLLDSIAEHGGTGVFAGHDISAHRSGPGFYSRPRQLRRFLRSAAERGIGFRTLSELARPPRTT